MTSEQRDLAFHLAIVEGYMTEETFDLHMQNEKVANILAGLSVDQVNAVGMEQVYVMEAGFSRQMLIG